MTIQAGMIFACEVALAGGDSAASMKRFPNGMTQMGSSPIPLGDAAEDDYTGFPKIIMYFGGDEIFAAEAPEYEKAFRRCGVRDYTMHVGSICAAAG